MRDSGPCQANPTGWARLAAPCAGRADVGANWPEYGSFFALGALTVRGRRT